MTLTNKLNEQLFTDLTPATAEVIQGGHAMHAYDGFDKKGDRLAAANFALSSFKYNNRISSIEINEGGVENIRFTQLPRFI